MPSFINPERPQPMLPRWSRWSLALAFLCSGLACHAQDVGGPIRIGLVGPFTGGSSDFGNSMRRGAEIAVKEINDVGGYLGRKFELVERDDKANAAEGRKAAEDLVLHEHVNFTIGYCNSGVAMNSLDVFQANQKILVVPCATGTGITSKYPGPRSFIFRVGLSDQLTAKFLVDEIVGRRGLTRIAILADSTPYGEGGVKDLSRELEARKLKPVAIERFPIGVKSIVDEMKDARDAGAQAMVVFALGPEHAAAARSRLEAGWKAPYFAPWTLSFRSAVELGGAQAMEGTMMAQSIVQDLANERRTSFLASYFRYTHDKHIGSLMAAAQAYDAVNLMLRALFDTRGNTDGTALKHALENMDRHYSGVVTTYAHPFSEQDHDAFSAGQLWLGVWRNGEIQFNYAEDAKRSAFIRRKDGSG